MTRPRATFEDRAANAVLLGGRLGIGCALLMLIFVVGSGSTFGQRCSRMHPGDDLAAAACVERLNSGRR